MNLNDWDGAPDWDSMIYGDMRNYGTSYRDVNYAPFYSGIDSKTLATDVLARPITSTPTLTSGTTRPTTIGGLSTSSQSDVAPSTSVSLTTQGSIFPTKQPSTSLIQQFQSGVYTGETKGLTPQQVKAQLAAQRAQTATKTTTSTARMAAPPIVSGGGGGGGGGPKEEAPAEAPAETPAESKKKSLPIVPIVVVAIVAYVLYKGV